MSDADYVMDVLGGASLVRETAAPATDLRRRVRRGLPYRSFDSVRGRLRLSTAEAAALLQMPPRTLARIAARAFTTFGSEERGAEWLRRPNPALNGEAPLALLDTDLGATQVDDLLGRIEHGIPG